MVLEGKEGSERLDRGERRGVLTEKGSEGEERERVGRGEDWDGKSGRGWF